MDIGKKCSSKEHSEIEAVYFCQNCNIYMCDKCEKFHSNMFQNHLKLSIDKDKKDIFTGLCKEKDHSSLLLFFCKTHNKLCCSSCLCNIKKKGFGQHKDCDVCEIEDIKEEKKNKYEENIKYLENIFNNIQESINNLKLISGKIEENREQFISKVKKIFTKLRNALNERENELLLIINEKFKDFYFGDEIIKENEKLSNQIKTILENNKKDYNKWNIKEKLNIDINECLEMEEKINQIKKLNSLIKPNSYNINIQFIPDENNINEFINSIKKFGNFFVPQNQCSICNSIDDLRKCLCNKIFCSKCLNNKKNTDCLKSCYLFNNGLNYINQGYNISKVPLPKKFELKLYFTNINNIRIGITCDKYIANYKKVDDDSPNYDIYYIYKNLTRFYDLNGGWNDCKGIGRELQSGDYMVIKLYDGKMKYMVNEKQLDFVVNISQYNDKEIYLLIHDRYLKSKCNIEYIAEIID